LEASGNHVLFALSTYSIRNFAEGELIDGSSAIFEDHYKNFFRYYEDQYSVDSEGEFINTTGFAGFRLSYESNIFYGWMQVSVSNYDNMDFTETLIDWSYESTPGVGILAGAMPVPVPEPTTTALLFAGITVAAVILRRRRTA
jgi:hypothetical protein